MIFEKVIELKMCVLIFSTAFIKYISDSRMNLARYYQMRKRIMYIIRYSRRILLELEHSRQIFEKSTNIKFHENPSGGRRTEDGRTDGHDKANIRFSQFCEGA